MAENGGHDKVVDTTTLRYLARILGGHREVSDTSLFPKNKPDSLVISINDEFYPAPVEAVRLEIRLYTNGEFHVSYFEEHLGDVRRCRWDRHDQPHSSRDHFHPLPSASSSDAADRDFPDDAITTLETVVLPWIEDRLGALWEE